MAFYLGMIQNKSERESFRQNRTGYCSNGILNHYGQFGRSISPNFF
ncbi:hypothetical protein LEP1GSC035_2820 [Leptospira noguchii str. 2007001578]|uniref:Uncharacterized protein n=1 Tax=Leptospira noguchii str. 2007001578 TaxID=1049974 RepID=A0ABN0J2B7_9LEPT|nr:hypothetical protein LEP1GSC035_2820 [Leptospira noguchii str. 2007001578]